MLGKILGDYYLVVIFILSIKNCSLESVTVLLVVVIQCFSGIYTGNPKLKTKIALIELQWLTWRKTPSYYY